MRSHKTFLALILAAAAAAPALAHTPREVRLVVGAPVPATAVLTLPQPVLARLAPAPAGHHYAIVGNDVVLVSETTDLITRIIEDVAVAPPVQAKLVVGRPVPASATFVVPRKVITRLAPAPAGHRYAIVGDDVVLVSNKTHRITRIFYDVVG